MRLDEGRREEVGGSAAHDVLKCCIEDPDALGSTKGWGGVRHGCRGVVCDMALEGWCVWVRRCVCVCVCVCVVCVWCVVCVCVCVCGWGHEREGVGALGPWPIPTPLPKASPATRTH